ncbi:MAG: arsenosugar biosynthesis radical SAM protein ArsS [Ketobacteraceae bacterium]|nr:arsenosugar biosynthesis radical SAM protein ArsS [Ketobacteraceae bacterium]
MQDTKPLLFRGSTDFPPVRRASLEILQVNLGYLCNLSCTHCHVNAGPNRTELMDAETVDTVIQVMETLQVNTLDLTGGAPELNPEFRRLVAAGRRLGVEVIDRCNLTVLNEPGQEDLADFLAAEQVRVVASLPCYSEKNVDSQRGKGVFDGSVAGLRKLNALGYGKPGSGLVLDLVYNPGGAFLPPPQEALERDYKAQLRDNFGIEFDNLLTITNMPISRFGAVLLAQGGFESYMNLLRESYSAKNLAGVMCRNTVSVDWQGYLYDCDFNQMLDIKLSLSDEQSPVNGEGDGKVHINELLTWDLNNNPVVVADHCFGCTAGQGSSCGGALE